MTDPFVMFQKTVMRGFFPKRQPIIWTCVTVRFSPRAQLLRRFPAGIRYSNDFGFIVDPSLPKGTKPKVRVRAWSRRISAEEAFCSGRQAIRDWWKVS